MGAREPCTVVAFSPGTVKPVLGLVMVVGLAACAAPPTQHHSMASLVAPSTSEPLANCSLWLDAVTDLRAEGERDSWHGMQRVDIEDVPEAVATMVRGLGIADPGSPEHAIRIEVVNAYLATVAGMRSFNLVLRVRHHEGEAWVARGRTVSVPWTLGEASVRTTLSQALADARIALVDGLGSRCRDSA